MGVVKTGGAHIITGVFSVCFSVPQSDSVSYFLEEIDRIENINYVPSSRDILYCRKATKGVHEFSIRISVSISMAKTLEL